MRELVRVAAHATPAIHPVLVAGIAQFQFVHIHPFVDGNGRTSRLLRPCCLYRAGYDFKRLFTLSEFYDRDRSAFYAALQSVREQDMDLTGWLDYFVHGLHAAAGGGQGARHVGHPRRRAGEGPRPGRAPGRRCWRRSTRPACCRSASWSRCFPDVSRRSLQRDLRLLLDKS